MKKLTVYRTSLPELLGLPADLRGAESSTSGVNFARMVIMKAVRKRDAGLGEHWVLGGSKIIKKLEEKPQQPYTLAPTLLSLYVLLPFASCLSREGELHVLVSVEPAQRALSVRRPRNGAGPDAQKRRRSSWVPLTIMTLTGTLMTR